MKAISIRQPWAWAIIHADKDVENRDWPTRYRGPILIHASKGMTREEYVNAAGFMFEIGVRCLPKEYLKHGGIIGMAELVDCVEISASPWFFGPYGFVLRNVRTLPFLPWNGRLGFFDVPDSALPPEALAA